MRLNLHPPELIRFGDSLLAKKSKGVTEKLGQTLTYLFLFSPELQVKGRERPYRDDQPPPPPAPKQPAVPKISPLGGVPAQAAEGGRRIRTEEAGEWDRGRRGDEEQEEGLQDRRPPEQERLFEASFHGAG